MKVLVTGGAGYIGSHTTVELLNAGHEVVCIDNFMNSKFEAVKRVETITGKSVKFYEGDIRDRAILDKIFTENKIDAVINFAGLKAVGESCAKPLEYYENNIEGLLILAFKMREYNVKNLVFSSSATVYGAPHKLPIVEDFPLSATNPYGQTKLMIEQILADWCHSNADASVSILRYFNPIGAHESGLLGEDPRGIPNNLLPYVAKVATGKLPCVNVFGDDYPTSDGTGVRDYIHVVDLAKAHICALQRTEKVSGTEFYNIGTGCGYSVLDVIKAFSEAWGEDIPYKVVARRSGDIASCYANPEKAFKYLGWKAQYGLSQMCEDAVRWQRKNPDGYPDANE